MRGGRCAARTTFSPASWRRRAGLPDALIEGIEWPSGSNRSVVIVALRDHTVVSNFLSVFLKYSQSSDISQSVSVLHGVAVCLVPDRQRRV